MNENNFRSISVQEETIDRHGPKGVRTLLYKIRKRLEKGKETAKTWELIDALKPEERLARVKMICCTVSCESDFQ